MTVAELKKKLDRMPDDATVYIMSDSFHAWKVSGTSRAYECVYIKSSPLSKYIEKYSME